MISTDEHARFCELLQALLGGDNTKRQQAEKLFQDTKQCDPDRLCKCLVTVATQEPDDTLRQQSAVLLRQCMKATRSDFIWPQVSRETQGAVKAQLLLALRAEQVRSMRHKVCDVVSVLACHELEPSIETAGWPELAPTLSQLIEATESDLRESAVRIFKDMLGMNPQVAYTLADGSVTHLLQVCCNDASPHVRKEAVLLFAAVLEHLPANVSKAYRPLLPNMLQVVQQFENNEDELQECLQALVQALEVVPAAFQQNLKEVLPMMLLIARARDRLGDGVRQMAFEFIVSLCEKKAKMCSKIPNFVQEAVHLCMEFMLELEEDEDWTTGTAEKEKGDEVDNYDVGEENIDRLAKALGADAVLDHVFGIVRKFVNADSWKHKYVAIHALSQCAETVDKESHVDEVIQLLVALLRDEHPRVRHAALHAIGQTSTDHAPYVQETHNDLVLPALSQSMDDQVVRVASHACAAFINFAEDLEMEALLPHMPDLMAKLLRAMVSPHLLARQQAITAVAVIAAVTKQFFVEYYQSVVPVLKQTIVTATSKEERALRGKAFECLSLLGLAVGRNVFKHDAQEAMEVMMQTASHGLDADDPQKTYIQESAQRICRALQEDFVPYLQYLLPGIYATLQMQPSEVVDPDAAEQDGDMTVDFLQDGKAIGLKTSQIEDFKGAVQMLAVFLEVLGSHYYDHLRETARHLLPALGFRFDDDVKREAISTWQELISAAKVGLRDHQVADESLVADLLRGFLQGTVESMRTEQSIEILQVQAVGMKGCIKAAGPGTMTPSEVHALCAELQRLLNESTQRQRQDVAGEDADEDDQAEAEQWRDTDQMLRINYVEVVGVIMEVYKDSFLQGGVEHFLPMVQMFLTPGQNVPDRYLALHLADDILDKLGHEGVALWPSFIGQVLTSIHDDDAWIRQAAAYGIMHGGRLAEFAQFAAKAATAVSEVIAHPQAKADGNLEATEAAVAALGVLCRWQGTQIGDPDRLLQQWVHALPLQVDVELAGQTHALLMVFVREGHPVLQRQVGKVCQILLEIYNRETSTEALNADIRRTFKEMGEQNLRQMNARLTEKQRKRIQKIIRDAK